VNDVIQGSLSKGLPLFEVPSEGIWIGIWKVVLDVLPGSLRDGYHKGLLERKCKEVRHRTMADEASFPVSRYGTVRRSSDPQWVRCRQ